MMHLIESKVLHLIINLPYHEPQVGNMFVADENVLEKRSSKVKTVGLLAFYEIVHLNRNFITLLTNVGIERK